MDLGNSLIKSCVHLLQNELPTLKYFNTLSPIPGFRNWLQLKLDDDDYDNKLKFFNEQKFFKQNEFDFLFKHFEIDNSASNKNRLFKEKLKLYLNSNECKEQVFDASISNQVKEIISNFLLRSCAFYLYNEKHRGSALNSVCNFHLKNGAKIGRINYAADLSDRGWTISYGLMVNYNYNLSELDLHCLNYLNDKKINVSESVYNLLNFSPLPKL